MAFYLLCVVYGKPFLRRKGRTYSKTENSLFEDGIKNPWQCRRRRNCTVTGRRKESGKMFIRKRDFLSLEEKVKELEEKVRKLQNFKDNLVFCVKCGCAVKKENAYETSPTVKKRSISVPVAIPESELVNPIATEYVWIDTEQEYIHHDYYCKEHAPSDGPK